MFVQGGSFDYNDRGRGKNSGTLTNHANVYPRQCPDNEEPVAGNNGNIIRDMVCYYCDKYIHIRRLCSESVDNECSCEVSNFISYRALLFNNFINNFLLQSNIYLIDCAALH